MLVAADVADSCNNTSTQNQANSGSNAVGQQGGNGSKAVAIQPTKA